MCLFCGFLIRIYFPFIQFETRTRLHGAAAKCFNDNNLQDEKFHFSWNKKKTAAKEKKKHLEGNWLNGNWHLFENFSVRLIVYERSLISWATTKIFKTTSEGKENYIIRRRSHSFLSTFFFKLEFCIFSRVSVDISLSSCTRERERERERK